MRGLLLILCLAVVAAELHVNRQLLTAEPAEKALLRVQYSFQNTLAEPAHNVTVLDPSFNRTNVKFEDGRRRAKVTFGTIKPGETPYVNLDMFPKQPGKLVLEAYIVTFNYNNGSFGRIERPAFGEFSVGTYRDFVLRESNWTHGLYALLAAIPVGVAPLLLACYLKHQRRVIYKNLKGQ